MRNSRFVSYARSFSGNNLGTQAYLEWGPFSQINLSFQVISGVANLRTTVSQDEPRQVYKKQLSGTRTINFINTVIQYLSERCST